MTRRRTRPIVLAAVAVVALTATAAIVAAGDTSTGDGKSPPGGTAPQRRLVAFDSCAQAEQQLRAAAQEHLAAVGARAGVAPGGALPDDALLGGALPDGADGADGAVQDMAPVPEAGQAPAAARGESSGADPSGADPAGGEGPAHSSTNVHEAGVDEPDVIKTDGARIVTVSRGTLRVVDAATRTTTGTLELFPDDAVGHGHVADLLLHGDRALVLVDTAYAWALPGADRAVPTAGAGSAAPDARPISGPRLLLVDLAGEPGIRAEYTVDGGMVDARAVDGTARVVVRSTPRLAQPSLPPDASAAERLAAQRQVIEDTPLSDWLPRYTTTAGGRTESGQVDCTAVHRPESYSGTAMVTVLTFDLTAETLGGGAPVTVVAGSETVYSNGTSLYVASDRRGRAAAPAPREDPAGRDPVQSAPVDRRTEIHKFDTSDAGPSGEGTSGAEPPTYVGSGVVDGWLVNQYAMSEWDDYLRVATTSGDTRGVAEPALSDSSAPSGSPPPSESTVYVLAERDGALALTGSVGGLGVGERIYSVRFAGPLGYVVTFRETDPLYTVDLRDPSAPEVRGELKITGYSSYLHPVGEGRLIGVGQEADEQGRVEGTQVSLFDVSDVSDPRRVAAHHVPRAQSTAEADPHAFLWWPETRTMVLPLTDPERGPGALVLRQDGDRFTEQGFISHPTARGPTAEEPAAGYPSARIMRSLVIGDTLWTLSGAGLAAHDLSALHRLAWLPL